MLGAYQIRNAGDLQYLERLAYLGVPDSKINGPNIIERWKKPDGATLLFARSRSIDADLEIWATFFVFLNAEIRFF